MQYGVIYLMYILADYIFLKTTFKRNITSLILCKIDCCKYTYSLPHAPFRPVRTSSPTQDSEFLKQIIHVRKIPSQGICRKNCLRPVSFTQLSVSSSLMALLTRISDKRWTSEHHRIMSTMVHHTLGVMSIHVSGRITREQVGIIICVRFCYFDIICLASEYRLNNIECELLSEFRKTVTRHGCFKACQCSAIMSYYCQEYVRGYRHIHKAGNDQSLLTVYWICDWSAISQ